LGEEELSRRRAEHYKKNRVKIRAEQKLYALRRKNPSSLPSPRTVRSVTQRKNEYERRKRAEDINYKTCELLRSRLNKLVRRETRSGSAVRDLGCTLDALRAYLESKFYAHPETGEQMTWSNHTFKGWHIDHIRPLSDFDLTDPEQFRSACHYTNLQPLWWHENLKKGARAA
jgi:hypothetical protein